MRGNSMKAGMPPKPCRKSAAHGRNGTGCEYRRQSVSPQPVLLSRRDTGLNIRKSHQRVERPRTDSHQRIFRCRASLSARERGTINQAAFFRPDTNVSRRATEPTPQRRTGALPRALGPTSRLEVGVPRRGATGFNCAPRQLSRFGRCPAGSAAPGYNWVGESPLPPLAGPEYQDPAPSANSFIIHPLRCQVTPVTQLGILCPNAPGHLNPTLALADALRARGHGVHFFLLGDPPRSVTSAGFEAIDLGGSLFPASAYRAGMQALGRLSGRAAFKHTLGLMARGTEAILENGPALVSRAGISALLVDQTSFAGGTLADRLGLPFATLCNALLLHAEPGVPPYFTGWKYRDALWARLRNRAWWAALERLYTPILSRIQAHRRRHGLPIPARIAQSWSPSLQISQQPQTFELPRRELPGQLHFVGPLRLPGGDPPVAFPWERLDGRPLIYASLGTLQNRIAGSFAAIAEACRELDAQLVMSTGRGVPPEALGRLAGDPLVVAYAPQRDLLAKAALAITHAGLNTVLDALSAGVPMVALPVANDQPGVAARVAWTGAGEVLPPGRASAGRLRPLVTRVLRDSAYRSAAERLRRAIQASGGAADAALLVENGLAPSPAAGG
jgi:zeaxanthin glucosyltransferase